MAHGKRPKRTAKDRTKYRPTQRRPRRGPGRRPERLGLLGLTVLTLIGLAIAYGAGAVSVNAVTGLRSAAGLTGATGRLQVQECWPHRHPKGSVDYSCLGEIVPHSAAPWAEKNQVWVMNESHDERGKALEVDCPATDGDCVRAGLHAVLEMVMGLYFALGFVVFGLGIVGAAFLQRRPERFEQLRTRYRRPAGWALATVVAIAVGLVIAFVAT
ncbi:hypothetical protein [Kitasatospora sp. MAP5-34]|uniref:hypothetical protein n=1 Tax=Kitasatospora sp. MAP5-34 TaxID=3035102 RepID=UPI00247397D7|nr:hypothetical protein [Kitasatospora sp. MAP5-34]MDH6579550.1 hypothetical protein [Kitasatospora sp. MAP5-34]